MRLIRVFPKALLFTLLAAGFWIAGPQFAWHGDSGDLIALADDDDDDGGDDDHDDDDDDDDDGRAAPPPRPDHVPDEVILLNPSETGLAQSQTLGFTPYSTEILAELGLTITRMRPPPGLDAPSALTLLRQQLPQEISELNHLYRPQFCFAGVCGSRLDSPPGHIGRAVFPSCRGTRCYGQEMIGWSPETSACSAGLRIGVIDTGADPGHPALDGQRIESAAFAPALLPRAPYGHGTAVLALLAGRTDSIAPGLLPDADFFLADVFHAIGPNRIEADAVSLARGLAWLTSKGVSAINVSLTGPENRVTEAAFRRVLADGVLIVAAAGNDGPRAAPRYPAAIEGVIGVTGVDSRLRVYRSAAQGAHIDFAAPGVRIWTVGPGNRGRYETGTSFAAPFVTAALALSATGRQAFDLETVPVRDLGPSGRDPVFGRGLIQAPEKCQAGNRALQSGTTETGGG